MSELATKEMPALAERFSHRYFMTTQAKILVDDLDRNRLIEFGIYLGRTSGWSSVFIAERDEDDEEEEDDQGRGWTLVVVEFDTKEAAEAFSRRYA
jgi:hypothetical protein